MRMRAAAVLFSVSAAAVAGVPAAGVRFGQSAPAPFVGVLDEHPAIAYESRPVRDPISRLNLALADGSVTLTHDGEQGYLGSVLDALKVPRDSQMLVFSKSGVQGDLTGPRNPRALLFNDAVVVSYVRGAPLLELTAHDPEQGVIFYTLPQQPGRPVIFTRRGACLTCHVSYSTAEVPGLLTRSMATAADGQVLPQLGNFDVDQRTPLAQRWGGWFVTGTHGGMTHLGNATASLADAAGPAIGPQTLNQRTLEGKTDLSGYPSAHSDIVALLVFQHETRMVNLLTRLNWEARVAEADDGQAASGRDAVTAIVDELVDYALFVGEAPLTARVEGTSSFMRTFPAAGPRDARGRSLRDLDLTTRLMRYPCSYMLYVEAFDSLPAGARAAVYGRLWGILSGAVTGPRYAHLSAGDRRAIIEILRETKPGLPAYFF